MRAPGGESVRASLGTSVGGMTHPAAREDTDLNVMPIDDPVDSRGKVVTVFAAGC